MIANLADGRRLFGLGIVLGLYGAFVVWDAWYRYVKMQRMEFAREHREDLIAEEEMVSDG